MHCRPGRSLRPLQRLHATGHDAGWLRFIVAVVISGLLFVRTISTEDACSPIPCMLLPQTVPVFLWSLVGRVLACLHGATFTPLSQFCNSRPFSNTLLFRGGGGALDCVGATTGRVTDGAGGCGWPGRQKTVESHRRRRYLTVCGRAATRTFLSGLLLHTSQKHAVGSLLAGGHRATPRALLRSRGSAQAHQAASLPESSDLYARYTSSVSLLNLANFVAACVTDARPACRKPLAAIALAGFPSSPSTVDPPLAQLVHTYWVCDFACIHIHFGGLPFDRRLQQLFLLHQCAKLRSRPVLPSIARSRLVGSV
jgi:hypothetical protein